MRRYFIDKNITRAKTLDTDFYKDAGILEESKEKIFSKAWQLLGIKLCKGPGPMPFI